MTLSHRLTPFLYICFVQALVATLGSLYFSEIAHFAPCVLCWYQRIAMYPLVALFGVGLVREDRNVVWYALPLVLTGWAIALYHNLLYYGVLPASLAPCTPGASCTIKYFAWFGFITIPLLSFVAFSVIGTVLWVIIWSSKGGEKAKEGAHV